MFAAQNESAILPPQTRGSDIQPIKKAPALERAVDQLTSEVDSLTASVGRVLGRLAVVRAPMPCGAPAKDSTPVAEYSPLTNRINELAIQVARQRVELQMLLEELEL